MAALTLRKIGRSGLEVTTVGLGGTGLGNMYRAVEDTEALSLVDAARSAGLRLIDTAPVYGFGLSETRIGAALRQLGDRPFIVSTKVGYRLVPLGAGAAASAFWENSPRLASEFDFSRDAALRSLEGSLERLGLDRVEMVAIHDPDEAAGVDPATGLPVRSRFREAMDGAYRALDALRSQGVVKAIGVGMNQWQMLADFARAGDFDYFLLAGRYTLLEQAPLSTLLPLCLDRGISVIVGGPYNSGILASGAVDGAYYNYAPASPEILSRVRRIEAICAAFGISLRAAALQFPLAHLAVASVIPGARSTLEMAQNLSALYEDIPAEFWSALKRESLIDPASP